MPLYEYQCDACERRFELIRKYSDPPVEVCPTCGGVVHKLASSPAIQFKGSGFYITDYAKKSNTPAGDTKDTKDTRDTKDTKESKDSKDSLETKDTKSPETSGEKSEKSSSSSGTKPESTKSKTDSGT